MNWEVVRAVATVLALLLSCAAFVFARRDRNSDAQKAAIARVENKFAGDIEALKEVVENRRVTTDRTLSEIHGDISTFREAIKHMPTVRDIDLLQNSLSELASAISKQQGTLESNTRMTERMNNYLMERGT